MSHTQAILEMLIEVSKDPSDDKVFLETHRIIKKLVQPSEDVKMKGAVINSKEFTLIIERIAWILESGEEVDRIEGDNPCIACDSKDCWHYQERQLRIKHRAREQQEKEKHFPKEQK